MVTHRLFRTPRIIHEPGRGSAEYLRIRGLFLGSPAVIFAMEAIRLWVVPPPHLQAVCSDFLLRLPLPMVCVSALSSRPGLRLAVHYTSTVSSGLPHSCTLRVVHLLGGDYRDAGTVGSAGEVDSPSTPEGPLDVPLGLPDHRVEIQ